MPPFSLAAHGDLSMHRAEGACIICIVPMHLMVGLIAGAAGCPAAHGRGRIGLAASWQAAAQRPTLIRWRRGRWGAGQGRRRGRQRQRRHHGWSDQCRCCDAHNPTCDMGFPHQLAGMIKPGEHTATVQLWVLRLMLLSEASLTLQKSLKDKIASSTFAIIGHKVCRIKIFGGVERSGLLCPEVLYWWYAQWQWW